ncbi:MAG: tetratricopeptide repeat protein [Bacteroidia bacterium]
MRNWAVKQRFLIILSAIAGLWLLAVQCQPQPQTDADRAFGARFLNLSEEAQYVGKEACRGCHADIYDSFLQTGMGRSFGEANLERSKADWGPDHLVYDDKLDLYYQPFVRDSGLYVREFRLRERDTLHNRVERISYVVGSGQHTNSHLLNINGYVYQMPITYYTQEGKWDLPPGFDGGANSRFSRSIQTECMTCHNAYPQQLPGSEHKYLKIQEGIDCERCHGPGSLHIAEKMAGNRVDTSKGLDYSIVNPRRLPVTLQMSICQRCHMQGNAVLKPGKSFYDFKPGMMLEDVISVFLPRYEGDQSNFTMASHPDRMMQSDCFKKSAEQLSCISCHNPHKSIEITPSVHYNNACAQCHSGSDPCSLPMGQRLEAENNCVSCHMPKSGTSDIPHVTITDHWIRKPDKHEAKRSSIFKGIASINEKRPDPLTIAVAWLQYYERFEEKRSYLDSAAFYLRQAARSTEEDQHWFDAKTHWLYLRGDAANMERHVAQFPERATLASGWTAYRIGEMMLQAGKMELASAYFSKAATDMPYQLDFQLKLAINAAQRNALADARDRLENILREQPKYVPAMANLGFISLQLGDAKAAENWYRKGMALDPDNHAAMMNMVGLMLYRNQQTEARVMLNDILNRYPGHQQARQLLQSLN